MSLSGASGVGPSTQAEPFHGSMLEANYERHVAHAPGLGSGFGQGNDEIFLIRCDTSRPIKVS